MIIALYGQSSSGKSTLAEALRQRIGNSQVRHCGELVKARAMCLAVSINDLSEEYHRAIDSETRLWSETQPVLAIVEGRYLQYVLARTNADVRVIEVLCSQAERVQRWASRTGLPFGLDDLSDIDAACRNFTTTMYDSVAPLVPALRMDTTSAAVDECVTEILSRLEIKAPECRF